MITNSPTRLDFEKVAKENLTQAFNLLFKAYDSYKGYDEQTIQLEVSVEDIWRHQHGTIRTALILLHQAVESLMKSVICDTTPLLLIDKPRKDWPTMPLSDDKDFDSLYTIGGESLLMTFCAVDSTIIRDSALINFIEEIRHKRNQAIHGTNLKDVTAEYVIENVLETFTVWFGKDIWHIELRENLIENPLFGYFDMDYESAVSYKFLDFVLSLIGKAKLSKHISADIRGRSYFCPQCKHGIEKEYDEPMESKWGFLNPNLPGSITMFCANCHQDFTIKRVKCGINKCRGNVLYEDPYFGDGFVCLTCFETHEYEDD